MSMKLSTGRVPAIYEFIKCNKDQFSIRVMCRLLGVAPERLLRVALVASLRPGSGGCAPAAFDPSVVHGQSGDLRRASRLSGSSGGRGDL